MRGYPGRCGYCERRRTCWPIQRFGGGAYNRAGRWYWGRICAECVAYLVEQSATSDGSRSYDRYGVGTLRRLHEKIRESEPT